MHHQGDVSDHERVEMFQRRQQHDLKRYRRDSPFINTNPGVESMKVLNNYDEVNQVLEIDRGVAHLSQKPWKNYEGDGLDDFGVDEDAEFHDDDDDVPIAHLLRKRRNIASR